jgi:hypothetical protein
MTPRFGTLLVVVLALALAACPKPSEPTAVVDAGAPAPVFDAGVDAGAAPPVAVELALTARGIFPDGGSTPIDFQPGTRPLVDPLVELELTVRPQLKNYRVRLFDDADKVVESDDEADDPVADQLSYRIKLQAPLKTGRHYALVLDAQTGEAIVDRAGLKHPDQRFELQVSGEKERPAGAKAPKKKKRR